MKAAIIVFPGTNRERDMRLALKRASGREPAMLFHREAALPKGLDLVVLPGWRAVLPVGPRRLVPVLTHPQLLWDRAAVHLLARELLRF